MVSARHRRLEKTVRPAFAECAAMSNFSLREGASHPDELVRAAKSLGYAAIGIADRNTTAGLVRGMLAAEAAGIRFLPGCRLSLEDGREYFLWPSDRAAWGRLTRLLSEAHLASTAGEFRIHDDALEAAAEGHVMAIVAPDSIDRGFADRLRADAQKLRRKLALPLFCAVHRRFSGDDRQQLDRLAALCAASGARLLAAGGVRFHCPERRALADVLTAIREKTTVDALGFRALPHSAWFLPEPDEWLRWFGHHTDAVLASADILQTCRFSLRELRYEYPQEIVDAGRTPQETLEARVAASIRDCWPHGAPEKVLQQIKEELALIRRKNYAAYFLTVHEIVRFARSRGILCQGRGSAANSAVCYVLGITSVPPDKHELLFERFISDARDEPPDIDVDFEHDRREEVIQHIYERYGRERAALCGTIIRYQERSAIRDVGKALGLSDDITSRLARAAGGFPQSRSLREVATDLGWDPSANPRLAHSLRLAEDLLDFPRHLATHVGGFVISHRPLIELAVIRRTAMEGRTALEWDKDDIEALGILKVDILGLGMLSCIRRCFDLIEQHTGRGWKLTNIPPDDPATYAMLRKADTVGVFQVESRAQMNMLPRLRPQSFTDLVIEVAIVRPGPIQGNMVHPYLRRRQGDEPVHYPSEAMRRVLERTLGVPLFQEQAMRLAIECAGFSPARADALRRAMGTFRGRGNLQELEEEFVSGMIARGHSRDVAETCFQQIRGFGSYGFPESHAASFAQIVYISAWLKCHYPAFFAAALLNSQPMGFYEPAHIIRDARAHGVQILPPDINASKAECSLEARSESQGGFALRLGLALISGIGRDTAAAIVAARGDRPFQDIADFRRRTQANGKTLRALAQADAFASLGVDRRRALWEVAAPIAPTPWIDPSQEAPPRLPPSSLKEDVALDYSSLGLSLRAHPMQLLRPRLRALGCQDSRSLLRAAHGAIIRLAGLVVLRQRPSSAKGVVFVTLEDEFGSANLVLYPDVAERYRLVLVEAPLVMAEGRVEKITNSEIPIIHIIVHKMIDISYTGKEDGKHSRHISLAD